MGSKTLHAPAMVDDPEAGKPWNLADGWLPTQPSMTGGGEGDAGGGGGSSQFSGHSQPSLSWHAPSLPIICRSGRHWACFLPCFQKKPKLRGSVQQCDSVHGEKCGEGEWSFLQRALLQRP